MTSHVIASISDCKEYLDRIFDLADLEEEIFRRYSGRAVGFVLGSLFFEPSTRTRLTFESAFVRLGGACVGISDIEVCRAGSSGRESMQDTARVLSGCCHCVAIRVNDERMFTDFCDGASVPVISAGHAHVEHPSQALVDLHVLRKARGSLDELRLLVAAEMPKRCVNSFLRGMSFGVGIQIDVVELGTTGLPESVVRMLKENGCSVRRHQCLDAVRKSCPLESFDVIYTDEAIDDRDVFRLSPQLLSEFRPNVHVMHSLPRYRTIPEEVDSLTSSPLYLEALQTAIYVRAALFLVALFGE